MSPFVQVIVRSRKRRIFTCALLDNGCETTLITKKLAARLGLTGPTVLMHLGTFHGQDPLIPVIISRCIVMSLDSNYSVNIHRVLIVPELQISPRIIDWPTVKQQWPNLKNLDLKPYNWEHVEMFLGANAPAALRQFDIRPASNDWGPEGILRRLGGR